MWINGSEMIGEVVEKENAARSTKAIRPCAATPACSSKSITSGSRCASFRLPPAPSNASASPVYQELDFDHDWATYVYPLATVTRPGLDARTEARLP